jgi:hypothetical protein
MSTLAERYIQLAYGIEHHFPGYVDAYFGPAELKNVRKQPLETLVETAHVLHKDATDASSWLEAQLGSMQTVLAKVSGQRVSYLEEVKNVYDIEPEYIDESHFEKAHAALDTLLEGKGSIFERLESLKGRFVVPAETLPKVIEHINHKLRQRTKKRFDLPGSETFSTKFVTDKPWGGYNWYEGNYRSRIDINMDLPKHLHGLPHLLSHEGYPGHHTERSLKEASLYRDQQKLEHSICLLNSPEAVQAEGIAENALEVVMPQSEVKDLLTRLLPVAKVKASKDDIQVMLEVTTIYETLSYVGTNAALLLHEQKNSEDEVLAYLKRYSLESEKRNQKTLEFLQAPTSASYVFTYTMGKALIQGCLKKGVKFEQLLREAYTPSTLRELAQS